MSVRMSCTYEYELRRIGFCLNAWVTLTVETRVNSFIEIRHYQYSRAFLIPS